jgi:hypothetical protein
MVEKLNIINHSDNASFELILALAEPTRAKCRHSAELSREFPQGLLRARRSFDSFAARVKSCPFRSQVFPQGCQTERLIAPQAAFQRMRFGIEDD